MIYEKKEKNKKKIFELVFDFFAYGYIALIFIVLFSLALTAIASITGDNIKGIDILNSLAQIATGAAFVFAVYQYRKNGEKERQNIISNEAKMLATRMANVADETLLNHKYKIQDINAFVTLMSNLGEDFMVLYEELTDDIHKAMVRMRWQEMHYNHLSKVLCSFTVDSLFNNLNLEDDFKACPFYNGRSDPAIQCYPQALQEYFFTKKILDEISTGDEIVEKFNPLYLFELQFFDHDNTNDLMYGLFSGLDLRASAPLLAAIKDRQKTSKSIRT